MGIIQESITQAIEQLIGKHQIISSHGWSEYATQVLRLSTIRNDYALKIYKNPQHFRQELNAYLHYLPREPSLPIPEIITWFDGPTQCILLSWVEGVLANQKKLSGKASEFKLFEAMGEIFYQFHGVAQDECIDAVALELKVAVISKIDNRINKLANLLPSKVRRWLDKIPSLSRWDQEISIGYCHRDNSLRNWIVDSRSSTVCALIDFELSKIDFRVLDIMKLYDGLYGVNKDHLAAFLNGYGESFIDDHELMQISAAIHGLASVNWSVINNDESYLLHSLNFLKQMVERYEH